MDNKPLYLYLLLVILLGGMVGAQEGFTPFAQNLRVAVKEPQVRISWEDASSSAKSFILYRYTEEITAENLSQATKVAELPAETSFYTDVPPSAGSWHYAILLKDKNDVIYELLIPFRNKTVTPVVILTDPVLTDLATDLSNLRTRVVGQTIEVTVLSSRNTRKVALYRSSKPIAGPNDLPNSVLLGTSSGSEIRFVDNPIPGVPYYYAAIDAEITERASISVVLGKNSLSSPTEINLQASNLAGIRLPGPRPVRAFPLPQLNQIQGPSSLPERSDTVLAPSLLAGINALIPPSTKAPGTVNLPSFRLLPSDRLLQTEDRGNSASLQEILRSYFVPGDYQEALSRLEKLARLELSGETRVKTRYYIAMTKAALEDWSGAVLDLLVVRDELRDYVEPWIEVAMTKL